MFVSKQTSPHYINRNFITASTRSSERHETQRSYLFKIRFNSIIFKPVFSSAFPTKMLYVFLLFHMHVT